MTKFHHLSALALALNLGLCSGAVAQKKALLPQKIDSANTVVIRGNTRPEVTAANDRGAVDDSMSLPALQMVLKRSPEMQAAFTQYLAEQTTPGSPNFHKWLTNAQIGSMFGPAQEDIATITAWLTSKGFTVNSVSPDETVIEFAGTAGQVKAAFKAPIHNLMVNGEAHFANVNDPELPSDLTPVVAGVASLNDFMPHSLMNLRVNQSMARSRPNGNAGEGYTYLGAADLATIYNFKGAFASGVTGKGQTVMVLEDTNQYNAGDFLVFRKTLGLSKPYPYGTMTQVNPTGAAATCANPGANGDDVEAALDVEWASAAAPNASIVNAACKDTTQFGGFLALQNVLTEPAASLPQVISISYGEAEAELGATENLYISNLYASTTAAGISLFVSSGDEGAASADADKANATHGIGVSGFTSTPYDVSVGGTDFGNVPLGTPGTYFNTTNGANFQTAVSYIPEIPWDDSCAGSVVTSYAGFPVTGPNSLCNSTEFGSPNPYLSTASGSGGPSGCATGTATIRDVVSGMCQGYAKPSWQNILGVPPDGVRDIPDVSLMSSNGFWGVYYALCSSDPTAAAGNGPCAADPADWLGAGGTSFASPIWAGIQALVNQSTGQTWGNSNPVLYSLAATEYGASGDASCNSELGNQVDAGCVFYDVTVGNMDVNCTGTYSCYNSGGKYGALSVSDSTLEPAYGTNVGWDFATGIGTTNVANLVSSWKNYSSSFRLE